VVQFPDCEGPPLTDEMVTAAERELGVTLPKAYVDLIRTCNGGYTNNAALSTSQPTGWASDHVPVDVIFGIPAVDDRGRFGTGLASFRPPT
jgi:endonuclease/exonuclease/phosphatase family metal-dependent hydrolase